MVKMRWEAEIFREESFPYWSKITNSPHSTTKSWALKPSNGMGGKLPLN